MEELKEAMALLKRREEQSVAARSFIDLIAAMLEKDMYGEVDKDKLLLKTGFNSAVGTMHLFVHAQEDAERVLILCMYDIHCCTARRKEVAQLITAINYGLAVGSFEMDFRDGDIRFRIGLALDETPFSGAYLLRSVMLAAMSMGRYAKTFTPLCLDMEPNDKDACAEYKRLKALEAGGGERDRLMAALERLQAKAVKHDLSDAGEGDADDEDALGALLSLLDEPDGGE